VEESPADDADADETPPAKPAPLSALEELPAEALTLILRKAAEGGSGRELVYISMLSRTLHNAVRSMHDPSFASASPRVHIEAADERRKKRLKELVPQGYR
jgi:hypothetical protein